MRVDSWTTELESANPAITPPCHVSVQLNDVDVQAGEVGAQRGGERAPTAAQHGYGPTQNVPSFSFRPRPRRCRPLAPCQRLGVAAQVGIESKT